MKKITLFVALCSFLCFSEKADAQLISTYAGDITIGDSGFGGAASGARFTAPNSVTTDGKGNVYISDYATNRVTKVDAAGIFTSVAGIGTAGDAADGTPATAAALNGPNGMTFDAAGNLYICEPGNNKVRKIGADGTITTFAGAGGTYPGTTGDGGAATAAFLYLPSSIVFDKAGNAFITDAGNIRIRKVDLSGNITTFTGAGGELGTISTFGTMTLAIDGADNIYTSVGSNVYKVTPSAVVTHLAGGGISKGADVGDGGPATAAYFNDVEGIAIDKQGNVHLADTYNNRVRMINMTSGIINTIAGVGQSGYYGNGGYANHAKISFPAGIAFDQKGNLYICEGGNTLIRKVNYELPTGVLQAHFAAAGLTTVPNPSNGSFSLHIATAANENADITIMSITGQRVKTITATTNTDISITLDVPAGNYFVIAATATERWMQQVVVQ